MSVHCFANLVEETEALEQFNNQRSGTITTIQQF